MLDGGPTVRMNPLRAVRALTRWMTLGLLTVFGAGLLTLFTPCVLPMVPVLLTMLLGAGLESVQSAQGRLRLLGSIALFVAGFSVVFTLLGMAASSIGGVLVAHRDGSLLVGAGVILLLGLKMLGWIRLGWLDRTLQLPTVATGSFGLNAVLLGVVFALGWTPCVGPVLASVLTYSASATSSPAAGAAYLFTYSLGVGVPLLAVGLATERLVPALRSLHRHLPRVQRFTGGLMVVAALMLLMPSAWSRVRLTLDSASSRERTGAAFQPALGGPSPRPRLVEFFSQDCPVCRRVQPRVDQLRRDCVTHAVEILQVDVSQPENAKLAQHFGITAVPVFRGFARDGTTTSEVFGERSLAELRSLAAGLLEGECAGQEDGDLPATPSAGCGVARAEADGPAHDNSPLGDPEGVLECKQPAL